MTSPYYGYLKNIALALFNRFDRSFSVNWTGGHIKFFSVKTLGNLLKQEGFGDIEFNFVGRFLPFLAKSMVCRSRYPGTKK